MLLRNIAAVLIGMGIIATIPQYCLAELRLNEIFSNPLASEFEWVELYNDGPNTIQAGGYILYDVSGKSLHLTGDVEPGSYIVATSSAVLNNSGDTVFLSKNGVVIESLQFGSLDQGKSYGWCSGTSSWVVGIPSQLQMNICAAATGTPSPIPTPTLGATASPTPTPSPNPTGIQYDQLFISEIFPYPDTNGQEWVEILNKSQHSVSLEDIVITDSLGNRVPGEGDILPNELKILYLKTSILNNQGDSVSIYDLDGVLHQRVSYTTSTKNQSISFDNQGTGCITKPSPGSANNPCEVKSASSSRSGGIAATNSSSDEVITQGSDSTTLSNETNGGDKTETKKASGPSSNPAAFSTADARHQPKPTPTPKPGPDKGSQSILLLGNNIPGFIIFFITGQILCPLLATRQWYRKIQPDWYDKV